MTTPRPRVSPARAPDPPLIRPTRAREVPYGSLPAPRAPEHGEPTIRLTAAPALWRPGKGPPVELWTFDGQFPGPVIFATVGDRLRLVVENRLPRPIDLRWPGPIVRLSSGPRAVAPGEEGVYALEVRRPGAAVYRSGAAADAPRAGLLGALVARPAGEVDDDAFEILQLLSEHAGGYLVNGCAFPFTDAYEVPRGRRVLLHVANAGRLHHAIRLRGMPFIVARIDGRRVPASARFPRDTQDVAPGEAIDIEFRPERPGPLLLHRHDPHGDPASEHGMATVLTVT